MWIYKLYNYIIYNWSSFTFPGENHSVQLVFNDFMGDPQISPGEFHIIPYYSILIAIVNHH